MSHSRKGREYPHHLRPPRQQTGATTLRAALPSQGADHHSGRVLIEQPDGTYRPVESQTDWARLDAMTEEEVERLAAEDMAEVDIDPDWMTCHSGVPPAQGAGDCPARPGSVGLAESPRTRLSDAYQCHFARVLQRLRNTKSTASIRRTDYTHAVPLARAVLLWCHMYDTLTEHFARIGLMLRLNRTEWRSALTFAQEYSRVSSALSPTSRTVSRR